MKLHGGGRLPSPTDEFDDGDDVAFSIGSYFRPVMSTERALGRTSLVCRYGDAYVPPPVVADSRLLPVPITKSVSCFFFHSLNVAVIRAALTSPSKRKSCGGASLLWGPKSLGPQVGTPECQ